MSNKWETDIADFIPQLDSLEITANYVLTQMPMGTPAIRKIIEYSHETGWRMGYREMRQENLGTLVNNMDTKDIARVLKSAFNEAGIQQIINALGGVYEYRNQGIENA